MASTATQQSPTFSQFACIGAGFSGIGLGATLKRWYNNTDVVFFERESNLGGTWYINQYPGCACDIPCPVYSFSFAPNGDWTQFFNRRHEILDYLIKVSKQYGLLDKMRFNSTVQRCQWIESRQRWRLTVCHTKDDTLFYHECTFLYSGAGQLIQPHIPNLPGLNTFNGHLFHAQRWDKNISLKDKRIIVVGNGCTADQIVPAVVDDARSVTQIARSKHWIVESPPNLNFPLICFLFRKVPGFLRLIRFSIWTWFELAWQFFYLTKFAAYLRKAIEASSTAYAKRLAPAKYHKMLIPDFPLGCKRRIFNPGYLESLNNEKITLSDDTILEVVPQGLRTTAGLVEADIIAFATGYKTNSFLPHIDVVGRNGETAEEHWNKKNGAGAYNTVLLSGFPNFFMILGPNSLTGHQSTIFAVENSINYSLRIIKPILDGDALSVDCTLEAEARYMKEIQDGLQNTVWAPGSCNNWYSRDSQGKQSHNASTYPFSQFHFWYKSLFPAYDDLLYTPPIDPRRKSKLVRASVLAMALAVLMASMAMRGMQTQGLKNTFRGHAIEAFNRCHTLAMSIVKALGRK